MFRKSWGLTILCVLAMPLLLASCGGDNGNPSQPSKADLTVLNITWNPPSPETGQAITVTITVKNEGDADAVACATRLKVDGTASCAAIVTPAIAKNQQATITCDIGSRTAGSHALEANVDVAGLIDESDETNNTRTANLLVVEPAAPDLIVQSITFTPNAPGPTESVIAHVTVKNQGTAAAVASVTSTEVDEAAECSTIATATVPAGGTVTVDCDFGTFAVGAHAARACADAGSAVTEANEANNCLTANFTVSPPDTPDLTIEAITFTPAQPTTGDAVTAHVVVRNLGSGAAAASVTSTDLDGTPRCASIATAAIPAGATVSVECALGTLTAGTHSIEACADAGSTISESSETNNCLSENLSVTVPSAPDLIVQSITFTPAEPTSQQPVTAHIVVRNQGTAAAAASISSTDVDGAPGCASITTATIPAGQSVSVDCALGTLTAGTHPVEACADAGSTISESSESNNCHAVNLLVTSVVAQPDLVIDGISFVPPNPSQGQPVTAQVTVRNVGGSLAAGSKTRVQLDGVTTCAEIATSSLPEGSSVVVNCALGTPSSGEHTAAACADIASEVGEGDEGNNCASESFSVSAAATFPAFPIPDISTCVDFQSTDPNAVTAQQTVQMQLTLVSALSSLGTYFFFPLQGAEWTDQGGGCWTWTYNNTAGCDWSYRVCQSGSGWEWTLTLDGTCDNTTYNNWVAFRATMNTADGTSGMMKYYDENTTTVVGSWTWEVAADGKSGTWSFYDGDASAGGTISNQVSWAKNVDDSQDTTWLIPDSMKSETHVSADCKSGYYKQYMWTGTPEAWHKYNEISWSGGHGYNRSYDTETEEVISEETW